VHGGAGRERGRGPEHHANDLKCPKLAPKSRAALQKRADSSEGNKGRHKMHDNMRELHQLHNEKKAHFRKLGAKTNEADLKEGFGIDGAKGFQSEEIRQYCADNDVVLQLVVAHNHTMQARVEGAIGCVKQHNCTALLHANEPTRFWDDATKDFSIKKV